MAGGRRAARAAALACVMGASAPAAGAQPTVRSARLVADLRGAAGEAAVRVEYRLSGLASGDSVGVTLLDYGLAVPLEVRTGAGGTTAAVPVALGSARRARLPVDESPDGEVRLLVEYRVPVPAEGDGGRVLARLPVLTVDALPEVARPGLFRADVLLPPGWKVAEAFPTGLAPAGAAGEFRAELAVVPSVVTLRVRTDGSDAAPLPLLLNLLTGACLAIVGIAGWRQLAPRAA